MIINLFYIYIFPNWKFELQVTYYTHTERINKHSLGWSELTSFNNFVKIYTNFSRVPQLLSYNIIYTSSNR